MINLLDYILDLFRDEVHAQAFVANPDQALADAGLSAVSSGQLQSVASTAIPSLAMGGSGDAVADLQQAVSSYYGFQPAPDVAPQTDFSPRTDLGSNNSFMSPTTNITDDHSVSFGIGDITLEARQLRRATPPSLSVEAPTATSSVVTARRSAMPTRSTTAISTPDQARP